MSSLASDANRQISSDGTIVNGFVAGLAGSTLYDEVVQQHAPTRTIRLSANSGSIDECDYTASVVSISEECEDIVIEDEDEDEYSMRISQGSNYPSKFSLLNLSSDEFDSSATLEITNCSTIDVTIDAVEGDYEDTRTEKEDEKIKEEGKKIKEEEDKTGKEDKEEERTEEDVFSPASCSSFGDFQGDEEDKEDASDCSADSFGEFDSVAGPPTDTPLPDPANLMGQCYGSLTPANYFVLHSSPKKILDNNFIWSQARSNVTKPSYSWDKLKLNSYLLGALSVRQPISLNRLKQNSSVLSNSSSLPKTPTPTTSLSPDVVLDADEEENVIEDWQSDISSTSSSTIHNNTAEKGCCKPCVPSILQKKLHRRSHSSPIPGRATLHPKNRCQSSSPLAKAGSAEVIASTAFDTDHATRGLSRLSMEELREMKQEMKVRVSELSTTLIVEFQYRGEADHWREVKKAFVSAFLLAEEKKSQGAIAVRQRSLLPIVCMDTCPSTEILVLLTQLLSGLINDTSHTADLLKHYIVMLCKSLD